MKLTVTSDFRTFKEGDTFELNFSEEKTLSGNRFLFLIGDNGCGKSTLMKALRKYKNVEYIGYSNHRVNDTFERNFMVKQEIADISDHIKVEGIEQYKVIDALDGELDDAFNYANSSSATDYIDNGGYYLQKLSNGCKSSMMFVKWLENIKPKQDNGRTLILFDEINKGWKIGYLATFIDIMDKHFKGCDFIVITHDVLMMLASNNILYHATFYNVEQKTECSLRDYIYEKTLMHVSASYIDYEGFFNKKRNKKEEEK